MALENHVTSAPRLVHNLEAKVNSLNYLTQFY